MSERRFEIGDEEKHLFTVDYNLFTKSIRIEQDAVLVVDEWHPSPLSKKFEFDVGSSERHHIEVTVGAFHPGELTVDSIPASPLP
ncbi:MAG: hypothetical protein ACREB9_05480 [Thermoplasmata archaeon]